MENQQSLRAEGYSGNSQWIVHPRTFGTAELYAPDKASAIWSAGKHWGANYKNGAFHQECGGSRKQEV